MAITVPELGAGVDLSPARGSRIQPADTYARPMIPPPADTSIGEAMSLLGSKMTGMATDQTNKEIEEQKANASLYASQVTQAIQNNDGQYDPNAINNLLSPLHPAVRGYVTQMAGTLRGQSDAQSLLQDLPPEALASPEGAQAWMQQKRAEALKASGSIPFWSAGYMQSVEQAMAQRLQGLDHFRQEKLRDVTRDGMRTNVYNSVRNSTPDLAASTKPDMAKAVYAWSQKYGYDPLWAMAVFSYETAGSLDPDKPNGADPTRFGLIQWGSNEQSEFGIRKGMPVAEQLEKIHSYMAARGFDPKKYGPDDASQAKMREDFYSTINAGSPGMPGAVDNGTTVSAKVARIQREHLSPAARALGLSAESAAPLRAPETYSGTPGRIVSTTGQEDPENFRALNATAKEGLKRIAGAFGAPLTITPHGGFVARSTPGGRTNGSQHFNGSAMDTYIADKSDADKTRLVATAIAQGAGGLGVYSWGEGVGTLHIDFREGQGNGPGGLAIWHRVGRNDDRGLETAPGWFREGVRQGLALRNGQPAPYRVASAGSAVPPPPSYAPRVGRTNVPVLTVPPPPAARTTSTESAPARPPGSPSAPDASVDPSAVPLPPPRPSPTENLSTEVAPDEKPQDPKPQDPKPPAEAEPAPYLPLEVAKVRDQIIREVNKAVRMGAWQLDDLVPDMAQHVINIATEKSDPRYLRAFPQEWMTGRYQKLFDDASRTIAERQRTEHDRARAEQEKQRKEAERQLKIEMNDYALRRELPPKEVQEKWSKIDPEAVKTFSERYRAIQATQGADRDAEYKKLESIKAQQRMVAARGGDPTEVPTEIILDPEIQKQAITNGENLQKTGGALGDPYYKESWRDAQRTYWNYAYEGALNTAADSKMVRINKAFEQHHEEALVKFVEDNKHVPATRAEKRQVFTDALYQTFAEFKPNNVDKTDKRLMDVIGAAPAPDPDKVPVPGSTRKTEETTGAATPRVPPRVHLYDD